MDTTQLIYNSYVYTLKKYNKPDISYDKILNGIGKPLRDQLEIFFGPMDEAQYQNVMTTYSTYQLKQSKCLLKLFPCIKETLAALKARGAVLGVVSSRNKHSLIPFLKILSIYDYFNIIVTPDLTTSFKPHPDPVLKALSELKAKADKTLFIGDSLWDIMAGKAAGVKTCFVLWSHIDKKNLSINPDYYIKSAKDLLD